MDYLYQENDGWTPATRHELDALVRDGQLTPDVIVGWTGMQGNGFPYRDIDADYFYADRNDTQAIYTDEALHTAADQGHVKSTTVVYGKNLPREGIQYKDLSISELTFSPTVKQFVAQRKGTLVTVVSGLTTPASPCFSS